MEEKIISILNKIKPFLNEDGGDVEFVKYEENIVYVKLIGNCVNCPHANVTLKDMIEASLMLEIPEIKEVIDLR